LRSKVSTCASRKNKASGSNRLHSLLILMKAAPRCGADPVNVSGFGLPVDSTHPHAVTRRGHRLQTRSNGPLMHALCPSTPQRPCAFLHRGVVQRSWIRSCLVATCRRHRSQRQRTE
jgi:hypothetical protein